MPLFQRTTNRMLRDLESAGTTPLRLPTEEQLAHRYGVSRATIRKALSHMSTCGVLRIAGHSKTAVRPPRESDFFDLDETTPKPRERVLDCLVDHLCKARDENKTCLTETELAKELGCNRQIIREELARISYYGLVVKQPHRGWKVTEFTEDLLMQIFEVREVFETHAMRKLLAAPQDVPVWRELEYILTKMKTVVRDDARSLAMAVKLDEQFHDTLLHFCGNRYMTLFNNMCHILIEYNLRKCELSRERILTGLDDHLVIIDALLRRDDKTALDTLHAHFNHARNLIAEDALAASPAKEA